MPNPKILLGPLPGLLTVILLLAFALAAWQMLVQAPAERRQVTEIRITLKAEEPPIILGYQELGQNPASRHAAEKDHLGLRRDAAGGWWASNVADHRKIDAPSQQHNTRYLKRWRLAAGDHIRIKGALVEVVATQGETLLLRESGREARWENERLITPEPLAAACPHEGGSVWRRWLQRADQERFLFSLGGAVPCPQRWPLPGVPVRGVEVLRANGAFWLAPGTAEAHLARASQPTETSQSQSFKNLEIRLDDPTEPTQSLILGRTHYRPYWQDNVLRLIPVQKTDLWLKADWEKFQSQPRDPRVITETTLATNPARLDNLGIWLNTHRIGALTALILALVAVIFDLKRPGRRNQNPFPYLRATMLAVALVMGILTAATWWPPDPQPVWLLLSLGLAWSTASGWLLLTGQLQGLIGWLWVAILGLIGCGSLVQGQLGLGGDNSHWLDFSLGHWRVLAVSGWILTLLALVRADTWRQWAVSELDPWSHQRFWLQTLVIAGALLMLAMQFAFGGEEGVWGIQPVEGIKVVLALMLAHTGARLQRRRSGLGQEYRLHPQRTFFLIAAFIIPFAILTNGLLWAVRDLSPFLLITLLVLVWFWHIAQHPTESQLSRWAMLGRWGIPAFGVLLLLLLLWVGQNPEYLPRWIPQYDRFMVWADPTHFRESGFQIWRALDLVSTAGWSGAATSPFGWNGAAMRVPVVQNDFIGAFVLYRFGITGGWAILFFQGIFVAALLTLSQRAQAWGQEKDASEKATGTFLSMALFYMTCLFMAHWAIAWGNTLALLPVMGQPMTFISAANSHHLFFALPGLALGLITGWMIGTDHQTP